MEAHHLVEKRFAGILGIKSDNIISIALTKEQHRIYTNRWRTEIPYGSNYNVISKKKLLNAAQKVYKDAPDLLDIVKQMLI